MSTQVDFKAPEFVIETEVGKIQLVFGAPGYAFAEAIEPVINRVPYGTCTGRFVRGTLADGAIGWFIAPEGRIHGLRKDWGNKGYNHALLHGPAWRKLRDVVLREIAKTYTPEVDRQAWQNEHQREVGRLRARLDELKAAAERADELLYQEINRSYPEPMPEYKL